MTQIGQKSTDKKYRIIYDEGETDKEDSDMICYLGMRKVNAECKDCGKHWHGNNAQGVAAIHARKYGHEVMVEILQYLTYKGE